MKKLINTKTVVKDGKATITGDVIEAHPMEFRFPSEQRTVGHVHPANPRHMRHIQISNEAVFVKAFGNGLAIPKDDFCAIAAAIEPKTASLPWFTKEPRTGSLTVEFSSELEPQLQWKVSDKADPDGQWSDIAGATSATLTNTDALKGKWVSCVATSEAGAVATQPFLIK